MKIMEFKGEYSFLSNFYPCMVYDPVDQLFYRSTEAYFQAQKCATKEERASFCMLDARESKKLGRQVNLRQNWDEIKDSVMLTGLFLKFTQNKRIGLLLAGLAGVELVEGNRWNDTYWGYCLKTHSGSNKLGKLLEQVAFMIKEVSNGSS